MGGAGLRYSSYQQINWGHWGFISVQLVLGHWGFISVNIYLLTYSRLQLLLIHNEPRSWQAAILYQRRGGWSYYYMHGAAPITQYMAASTQFDPLSQQIIIYVRAKPVRADVIRNVRSIIINNVTNLLCYQRRGGWTRYWLITCVHFCGFFPIHFHLDIFDRCFLGCYKE